MGKPQALALLVTLLKGQQMRLSNLRAEKTHRVALALVVKS